MQKHLDVRALTPPQHGRTWLAMCWSGALGIVAVTSTALAWGQPPAPGQAVDAPAPLRQVNPEPIWPGMNNSGSVTLPNGWSLKPAGVQIVLGDFPVMIAPHPTANLLAVQHAGYGEHEIMLIDTKTNRKVSGAVISTSFAGIVWSGDGRHLFVSGGFDDVVHRFDFDGRDALTNRTTLTYPDRTRRVPGGMAITSQGETLAVANVFGHSVALFNLNDEGGTIRAEIPLGEETYPYTTLFDEPRGRLYVSLWGGAKVVAIDLNTAKVVGEFTTQEHPNEMLMSQDGQLLYVANANRNTVSVVELGSGRTIETISTAIAPNAPPGCTPGSLALDATGSVLYVANANTNDLAVINVETPGRSRPLGFVPTGWYPTAVRLSNDGQTLYVTNGKGGSSRANRNGPNPLVPGRDPTREYIGKLFPGTLSILPTPTPQTLPELTKTALANCPLRTPRVERVPGGPIPLKVGDPSPIKYCVYIIKENRTYDQVFGDIPEGNGDPDLCLFPEEITPNHHALAREFVLLDNFYVESEVSADGHEWTMGAYATDFVERIWPLGYRGDRRVPYPAEGAFEIAFPAGGYLWDKAAEKGVTYRSYGEFVALDGEPKVKSLIGHFDPKFPTYNLNITDVRRANRFLEELKEFEAEGNDLPRLITMRLPNDHSAGTRPGAPTVQAMVADNDLALGMVVEGLSRSRFWKELAIFVVEDDAQNGSDHVDAHRTVALVIGPYVKRKVVDSTMYSTSSMLRTIELILGLDPMSQFDAAATPMDRSFTAEPDFTPYTLRPARVDLDARNTETAWGAATSLKLNLDEEDQADDLLFNEIIWKAVKGADSPMPPPVRAAFVLPRE